MNGNKVDELDKKLEAFKKATRLKIEKIQAKCKHINTERWSDYGGVSIQCKDCNYYLR